MLIIFLFLLFVSCSPRGFIEIDLSSRTHWFVQETFSVGSGEQKAEVSAQIVNYQESPSFFDPDGKVRGYSVEAFVIYHIKCQDKAYNGTRSFSEFFTAKDPYSYKIGIQRVRQLILKRIKAYLIGESEDKCFGD